MNHKPYKGDVCNHSRAFTFDNWIRRLFQNPQKITGEYINPGSTIIDLGCGPGFFSIDMAKMTGHSGKVYAVDLQKEMLDLVQQKMIKLNLTDQIILHQCSQDLINLNNDVKADFILAFYMVHETPDPLQFLKEVKTYLNPGGRFLIVEPLFHVSKKKFESIAEQTAAAGYKRLDRPKKKGGMSLLLTH